ncbi:MAG: hypothetical protein Q7J35_02975 [Candidatus Methanoperedens sp.]|nr:hypothetical protein [Candidatus Methanoperedens sp.]
MPDTRVEDQVAIGFAMPIQPAMWVAEQLIEHGVLVRPWISINAVDVNPKLVAYYDLPTEKWVVVTNVIPGSEAENSGIEVADILVRMDDETETVKPIIIDTNKEFFVRLYLNIIR